MEADRNTKRTGEETNPHEGDKLSKENGRKLTSLGLFLNSQIYLTVFV